MKSRVIFPELCFLLALACAGGSAQAGPVTPRPAAPVLFTPLDERSASFTRDGRTVYFAVRVGDGTMQTLCVSTRTGHAWSEPAVLPFSGQDVYDTDPFVTPDGHTLYFASSRPTDGKPPTFGKSKSDLDIWVVARTAKGWGTPHPVDSVNSPASDRSPILAPSGKLYFSSTRSGAGDLYVAPPRGPGFGEPVALGDGVNSPASEAMLAVSPDEKTLVFAALGRPDETLAPGLQYPRGDLFVSHWTGTRWGPSRKLGPGIDTNATELSPMFSPDGRTLYFMSERGFATNQDITLDYETLSRGLKSVLNGRGNIYAVDARVLDATAP